MRPALSAILVCVSCLAQNLDDSEQKALSQALSEAGSSSIEMTRALEAHLDKFPKSPKRAEVERILVRAAMENRDDRRIILYGERVLARQQDDLQVLDRVARALLASDAKEPAERALKYAGRFEQLVLEMRNKPSGQGSGQAPWREEVERGLSRALSLEARAVGNLGSMDQAIVLARQAHLTFPTSDSAREVARWLARSNKEEEAVTYLAEAFVLADPKGNDADRAADRARMGELYRKARGSEKGLGDVILAAYDRTSARTSELQAKLLQADPNAHAEKVLDFTISGLKGGKLALSSLKGKAVVFDFWATWCGPCRAQHPLYEEVKQKYRFNPDVVFLSVNTDEDRSLVEPFIKDQKWSPVVYFEDGMTRKFAISSIPTTLVLNREGEITSRMNGFVPPRFVEMLTERIEEALK